MPSPIDKIRLTRAQDRRAKVTEEQCKEMRVLYSEGIPQYVIAKKYGISQSAVCYIVSPKAHENLRKYRQINPPKRRTTEEARIYKRSLREYKRSFLRQNAHLISSRDLKFINLREKTLLPKGRNENGKNV